MSLALERSNFDQPAARFTPGGGASKIRSGTDQWPLQGSGSVPFFSFRLPLENRECEINFADAEGTRSNSASHWGFQLFDFYSIVPYGIRGAALLDGVRSQKIRCTISIDNLV
jgi:hypothetical protein